jgi:hypothetical protein
MLREFWEGGKELEKGHWKTKKEKGWSIVLELRMLYEKAGHGSRAV